MSDDDEDLIGTPKKRKAGTDAPAPGGQNSLNAREEFSSYVERYERLEEDKKAIASDQKDLMAEAKGRGYDVAAMRTIISERKKDPRVLEEHNAICDLYREIMGMI